MARKDLRANDDGNARVVKSNDADVLTLADLAVGERARVARVGGQADLRHRLLEMGMTPGCRVRLIRVAPLGDPLAFELRGYHLGLRRDEARHVFIE
jgi:Fe2+ transport system protein FeoA